MDKVTTRGSPTISLPRIILPSVVTLNENPLALPRGPDTNLNVTAGPLDRYTESSNIITE